MTPVKQLFRHKPPHTFGDCHRAAIASLLDLPLLSVPHFNDGLTDANEEERLLFKRRETEWFASQNLTAITFPISGYNSIEHICRCCLAWNPNVEYFLFSGLSKNEVGHTVIANRLGIVFDPSIDDSGIIGPMSDEFYWITYVLRSL